MTTPSPRSGFNLTFYWIYLNLLQPERNSFLSTFLVFLERVRLPAHRTSLSDLGYRWDIFIWRQNIKVEAEENYNLPGTVRLALRGWILQVKDLVHRVLSGSKTPQCLLGSYFRAVNKKKSIRDLKAEHPFVFF